jgi:hypothetical protein
MVIGQKWLGMAAGCLVAAALSPAAGAAVLVNYSFGTAGQETTAEDSPAFSPTSQAAGIIASAIQDTSGKVGIEISSAATTPAGAPFNRVDPQGNATSAAAAVANGVYFDFTVTPSTTMSLTNLTLDAARGGGGTPRGYEIRSSRDNFGSTLSAADLLTVRPTYTPITVDLSGAAFQNVTTPTTFRFYVYSPAGGQSVDVDNITLNGTVPEPASLGLIGLGAAGLLGRRARRN